MTISITNPGPYTATGILLMLNDSETQITGVVVQGKTLIVAQFTYVMFDLPASLSPDATVEVSFEFKRFAERAEPSEDRVILISPKAPRRKKLECPGSDHPKALDDKKNKYKFIRADQVKRFCDKLKKFVAAFKKRHRVVKRMPAGPRKQAAEFMLALDEGSHPILLREKGQIEQAIRFSRFGKYLSRRTHDRAQTYRIGVRFEPDKVLDEKFKPDADSASEFLKSLIVASGLGSSTKPDVDQIEKHFLSYVRGELLVPSKQVPSRLGAPDGHSFLSFAELVLYFLFNSIEVNYWQRLLRPFVMLSEVFVELYWSRGSRSIGSYRHRFLGNRKFTDQEFARLKEAYKFVRLNRFKERITEWTDPSALAHLADNFSDLVARAFRDTISLNMPVDRLVGSRVYNAR